MIQCSVSNSEDSSVALLSILVDVDKRLTET